MGGLLGGGLYLFWWLDAVTLTHLEQSHAKGVTRLLRFSRGEVGNSCLPTTSLLCELALGDALFGDSRDEVIPFHAATISVCRCFNKRISNIGIPYA